MPTPEEQREYSRLSEELQRIGHSFIAELPPKTVSLKLFTPADGKTQLDAYDRDGKWIGHFPGDQTSQGLRAAIERLGQAECPDPDGIVALL